MIKESLLIAIGLPAASTVSAGPIEMAHKAGFVSCDGAINTALSNFNQISNDRINIEYDDIRMKNKSISFLVTYGDSGDTALQKTTFVNNGGSCLAYVFSQITTARNCIQYMAENPNWKYIETQGDNILTQNQGGVVAILKNSPANECIISFNRSSDGH